MIECSETRVVYENPRGGLPPLRQFILEPKGGTGMRHVWDDVTGHPTAYPVKNHTPVSLLTPAHSISYGEWIATVTAAAPPTPTPRPKVRREATCVAGGHLWFENDYMRVIQDDMMADGCNVRDCRRCHLWETPWFRADLEKADCLVLGHRWGKERVWRYIIGSPDEEAVLLRACRRCWLLTPR